MNMGMDPAKIWAADSAPVTNISVSLEVATAGDKIWAPMWFLTVATHECTSPMPTFAAFTAHSLVFGVKKDMYGNPVPATDADQPPITRNLNEGWMTYAA